MGSRSARRAAGGLLAVTAFVVWLMDVRLNDETEMNGVFRKAQHDAMTTRCNLFGGLSYARRYATLPQPSEGKAICSTGEYTYEYSDEVFRLKGPTSWADVAKLPCIYINFGGDVNRHTHDPSYSGYVAVQGSGQTDGWGCAMNAATSQEECGEWCVCADLRQPVPLPDNSVDRIHSEDFMEHIHHTDYPKLLKEIYRLLKPGGRARMGMPDYGGQQIETSWAWKHSDQIFPERGDGNPVPGLTTDVHRTLSNYALLDKYIRASPFGNSVEWLQYFDNTVAGEKLKSEHLPEGSFVNSFAHPIPWVGNQIDYTLGVVRRTPDIDCRNNILRGNNKVVSLVFDLMKPK